MAYMTCIIITYHNHTVLLVDTNQSVGSLVNYLQRMDAWSNTVLLDPFGTSRGGDFQSIYCHLPIDC